MALILKDRIRETTSISGTATYELDGATTGFEGFSEIGTGNTTYYCCTDGTSFEIGIGTFTDASPDTLARTTILQAKDVPNGTTDVAVNWADTSAKDIFCTMPSDKLIFKDENNDAVIKSPDGAILTLQTSDTTVLEDDTLGEIHFQAPDEADGSPVNDKIAKIKTSVHTRDLGEVIGRSVYTQFDFLVKDNFIQETAPDILVLKLNGDGAQIAGDVQITGKTTYPTIKIHNKDTSITNGDVIGQIEFQAPYEDDGAWNSPADNVVAKLSVDAREDYDADGANTSMGIHLEGTEYFRFAEEFGQYRLNLGSGSIGEIRLGYGIDGAGTGVMSTKLGHGFVQTSSASGGLITLEKTSDSVVASHSLGTIRSKAPNETSGGDAILPSASMQFVAEAEFTDTANPTAIVFSTATSGEVDTTNYTDEKFRVSTTGVEVTGDTKIINPDTSIIADQSIGKIEWQAPNEASGGKADDVTAKIEVKANYAFNYQENVSRFEFYTHHAFATDIDLQKQATIHPYGRLTLHNNIPTTPYGTQGSHLTLERNNGSTNGAEIGNIFFKGNLDTDNLFDYAEIEAKIVDSDDAQRDGSLHFKVSGDGGGSASDVLKLEATKATVTGNLSVNASGSEDVLINSNGLRLRSGKTIMFEGATDDFNETFLDVVDPTSDRTIKLPNASGTINELLVASGSVSDVASIDFNSSIITTDFVGYRIELRNLKVDTDNVSCKVRIGKDNTAITSNNYRFTGSWAGGYQYGASYWSGTTSNASGDSFVLNANTYNLLGNATGENAYFNFVFPNASSTSCYKLMTACDSIIYGNYPMWQTTRFWGGVLALYTMRDASINYITVFLSAGNITSADYRVYGIV